MVNFGDGPPRKHTTHLWSRVPRRLRRSDTTPASRSVWGVWCPPPASWGGPGRPCPTGRRGARAGVPGRGRAGRPTGRGRCPPRWARSGRARRRRASRRCHRSRPRTFPDLRVEEEEDVMENCIGIERK